jgi:hypothetical protein
MGEKDLNAAPFIAESGEASLYKESLSRLQVLLTGRLRLTREQLILSDGNQNLSLNLADVSSITTESNFKLQLYDSKAGQLYQLVFPGESVLKWQDLLALTIREVHGRTPNLR